MVGNSVTNRSGLTTRQAEEHRAREMLKRDLLDAAGRLLVEEDSGALTMRRIAREVNCSTKMLYTLFGGKRELIEELWLEGFDRLRLGLEAVEHLGDRWAYVVALGRAYRENALANPKHYALMFGRAMPGFEPSKEGIRRSEMAFGIVVDAVGACVDAGIIASSDRRTVASVLWATVHGVVSLELASRLQGNGPSVFDEAVQILGEGYLVGERQRDK